MAEPKKSIQLTTPSIETLLSEGKSWDFRLDEAAWQDLQIGDFIEFWEDFTGWQTKPAENSRRIIVQIKYIFKSSSFIELLDAIELDIAPLKNRYEILSNLRKWWTEEQEIGEGVMALHVVTV